MKTFTLQPTWAWLVLLSAGVGLAACTPKEEAASTADATAAAAARDARYVAMARGRVDVPGGLLRVTNVQGGAVQRWSVKPGDTVTQGQVLAQLDTREASNTLQQAKVEQAHAEAELRALQARLPGARTRATRLQQAQAAGAGSGQAVDDARAVVTDAEQQLAVQQTALAVVKQRAAQATQTLAMATIRAPAAGRIVQRTAEVGEYVPAHGVLLHLLPDVPRIVRADLNESMISRVKAGMRAEVVSMVDGATVYSARVLSIGDVFGPPGAADTAGNDNATDTRVVECLLQLDQTDLRVGQRVMVRFLPLGSAATSAASAGAGAPVQAQSPSQSPASAAAPVAASKAPAAKP
jgi:membrane fusion protein, macrolide-specific efflux system